LDGWFVQYNEKAVSQARKTSAVGDVGPVRILVGDLGLTSRLSDLS
jgi:hypothetical protein